MTQNESNAKARTDHRATWTMPSGARTSGTFAGMTEDEVRASITTARGRDIAIARA